MEKSKENFKIGILTFHYGANFGGVLQAYALQQALIGLGYSATIINICPRFYRYKILRRILLPRIKHFSLNKLKEIIIHLRFGYKSLSIFDDFRKEHLIQTKPVSLEKLPLYTNNFNAIIVGSDQIWNESQHKFNTFFLNWDTIEYKGLKISYAACCGKNTFKQNNRKHLCNALKDFNYISVRDQETVNFVHNLIEESPPIVADPTLLHDFNEFSFGSPSSEKYILTYILGNEIKGGNSKALEFIKNKYNKMQVFTISAPTLNPQVYSWADDKVFYNISPKEWVQMIKNASFFFTDSFHGTLFALKYHVPFISYHNDIKRSSRFLYLRDKYHLKNIVSSVDDIQQLNHTNTENLDFKYCDTVIAQQKEDGLLFLKTALNMNE